MSGRGKHNIFSFGGAFRKAKYEIRQRRKNRNRKARVGKSLSRAATRDSFPPTPFLFARPSVQFLPREARHQFCSKKVRISSNKRTSIKLSGILPIDSAARSAAENGNTGSPRAARLAKRRFEIPCDFKYLLCPIKN